MSNVVIRTLSNMSAEEIDAIKAEAQKAERIERTRPLTESEVSRLMIAQQINTLTVDDKTALRMKEFYPTWKESVSYTSGFKVQHNGKLFRCLQEHTSQAGWEPSINTASLWEEICESHDGTLADPIPYSGNMALENGKYYMQDGMIYKCVRDTVAPVYNALNELVGLYVETA